MVQHKIGSKIPSAILVDIVGAPGVHSTGLFEPTPVLTIWWASAYSIAKFLFTNLYNTKRLVISVDMNFASRIITGTMDVDEQHDMDLKHEDAETVQSLLQGEAYIGIADASKFTFVLCTDRHPTLSRSNNIACMLATGADTMSTPFVE